MTAETLAYSLESVLKEIKDSIKSVDRKLDTFQTDVDQKLDNLEKSFDQKLDNLEKGFEQKLETLQKNVEQKLDNLQKNVTDVKIGLATLTEKVDSMDNRLIKVEGTQSNQICCPIMCGYCRLCSPRRDIRYGKRLMDRWH